MIVKLVTGIADTCSIYYDCDPPKGVPFIEINEADVPQGEGVLCFDAERGVLYLRVPEAPEPTPDQDRDELIVDLEYRLTLVELGIV